MITLVKITVDLPYPKEFEFRQEASGIHTAVRRALQELRKQLKGKRIKHYKIIADIL